MLETGWDRITDPRLLLEPLLVEHGLGSFCVRTDDVPHITALAGLCPLLTFWRTIPLLVLEAGVLPHAGSSPVRLLEEAELAEAAITHKSVGQLQAALEHQVIWGYREAGVLVGVARAVRQVGDRVWGIAPSVLASHRG